MEEYINAAELAARIKEKKQTIYNRIYKKDFLLGIHYVKPTPKKLLFKWNAIVSWLENPGHEFDIRTGSKETVASQPPPSSASPKKHLSSINI